jgi:hypothetical protein
VISVWISPVPKISSTFNNGVHMRRFLLFLLLFSFWTLPAQEEANCACCTDAHRAFDFWVGTWEVRLADGTPAGINRIVRAQGGCVLQEHWESAQQGSSGTSLNFFNSATRQWEQLWVDNSGNILKLKGGLRGDQMVLASDPYEGPDGQLRVNRITWTIQEDGIVRQLWEVLQEDEVVQVLFDGYYHPVPEGSQR